MKFPENVWQYKFYETNLFSDHHANNYSYRLCITRKYTQTETTACFFQPFRIISLGSTSNHRKICIYIIDNICIEKAQTNESTNLAPPIAVSGNWSSFKQTRGVRSGRNPAFGSWHQLGATRRRKVLIKRRLHTKVNNLSSCKCNTDFDRFLLPIAIAHDQVAINRNGNENQTIRVVLYSVIILQ